MENSNIFKQDTLVSRKDREKLLNQTAVLLWFTGLPSAGKTTIAKKLEFELHSKGYLTYMLDGDNVRSGLNKDLGFSKEEREENIRRVGNVAKLFFDAGFIVITAFISPYKKTRDWVKKLIGEENYIEVFINCPLDICIQRDPKGLYKKALKGEIQDFTGISSDYEEPLKPDIKINSDKTTPKNEVAAIMNYLMKRGYIKVDKKR